MRKMLKKKSKSLCGMCKAYKTGGDCRWTNKEKDAIKRFERAKNEGKLDQA